MLVFSNEFALLLELIQMESRKKSRLNPIELKMKDTILSNVETATHLGIKRSKTDK
jgi:hypothetical protein